jgi:hypothetical protein
VPELSFEDAIAAIAQRTQDATGIPVVSKAPLVHVVHVHAGYTAGHMLRTELAAYGVTPWEETRARLQGIHAGDHQVQVTLDPDPTSSIRAVAVIALAVDASIRETGPHVSGYGLNLNKRDLADLVSDRTHSWLPGQLARDAQKLHTDPGLLGQLLPTSPEIDILTGLLRDARENTPFGFATRAGINSAVKHGVDALLAHPDLVHAARLLAQPTPRELNLPAGERGTRTASSEPHTR